MCQIRQVEVTEPVLSTPQNTLPCLYIHKHGSDRMSLEGE